MSRTAESLEAGSSLRDFCQRLKDEKQSDLARISEQEKIIARLRGQLQNCVSHLERARRQRLSHLYDEAIESANRALYETLIRVKGEQK